MEVIRSRYIDDRHRWLDIKRQYGPLYGDELAELVKYNSQL